MTTSTMRKGFLFLLILLACLSIGVSVYSVKEISEGKEDTGSQSKSPCDLLSFRVKSKNGAMANTVHCIQGSDGIIDVFLPSYADMGAVTVSLPRAGDLDLSLNGTGLCDGLSCEEFPLNTELTLRAKGYPDTPLIFLMSANVATLFIDTESGNMEAVHADKTAKEYASVALLDAQGACDYASRGTDKIRGHGQSSWERKKKPYNLYLHQNAELLNMSAAKKWVLVSNVYDKSNLRNWLVYTVAGKLNTYPGFAPKCAFVDLYLNGRYNGLYLLCDKVEIYPGRLGIDSDSWLFCFDQEGRKESMKTSFDFGKGIVVEVKNPSDCTEEQVALLRSRLLEFQTALLSGNGINPQTGMAWADYIDLDSFARKYLIEEVFENYDAGACSQYYFWNAADGLLYAGPCWDYDLILGSVKWQDNPRCFLARREWKTPNIYTPWFYGLWRQQEFQNRVMELYRTEFLPLLEEMMESGIAQKSRELKAANSLNSIRWVSLKKKSSYKKHIKQLQEFLEARVAFLNSAWIDHVDYKTVTIQVDDTKQYKFYSVPADSPCTAIPAPQELGLAENVRWCLEDGTPFDPQSVLIEDILLRPGD